MCGLFVRLLCHVGLFFLRSLHILQNNMATSLGDRKDPRLDYCTAQCETTSCLVLQDSSTTGDTVPSPPPPPPPNREGSSGHASYTASPSFTLEGMADNIEDVDTCMYLLVWWHGLVCVLCVCVCVWGGGEGGEVGHHHNRKATRYMYMARGSSIEVPVITVQPLMGELTSDSTPAGNNKQSGGIGTNHLIYYKKQLLFIIAHQTQPFGFHVSLLITFQTPEIYIYIYYRS